MLTPPRTAPTEISHRLNLCLSARVRVLIKPVCCLVLSCLMASVCQAGQYYKWVDGNGITHFSEKPVVGSDAKKMGTSSKTAEADATPEAPPVAPPVSTGAAAPQVTNDENCKIAQDRMKALNSGQRIRLIGPDGKFSYLEQNQIQEEIKKTQEVLNASCSVKAQ